MDKRVLRERMRRKKRQMMIRHYTKIGLCVIGMILAVVFVVRGIIIPIAHHVAGGGSSDQTVQAQADTEEVQANSDAAVRQPLKGKSDTDKIAAMTAGWHEDANGKWYQNTDGTYFSNGFQDIDGVTYSFDENGYIQTGWVEKGVKDYYFNEDGSYDPSKVRPMLALTFDDGPGQYTDELLDCLEQNNAHATFFMLGQNVSAYPDAPKRMLELGCEVGSHSWDHTQLTTIDLDAVAKQFSDTDDALIQACGQAASVARAPYGDGMSAADKIKEADWRLFRSRLPIWQEAYMERLNREYIALLSGTGSASEKFWELEKRVREDKRRGGVVMRMSRGDMELNLLSLLSDGVISTAELDGFSEELREKLTFVLRDHRDWDHGDS